MNKIATMTDAELRRAARRYEDGMNEGGEGYNPYSEEICRRAHAQAVAERHAEMQTPQGKIDALHKRIEIECGSVAREWGNTDEIDKLQHDLYAQIDAIKADMDANLAVTWSREKTIARRAAWNDMVRAGKFGECGGGRTDFAALSRQQKEQGWTLEGLKRAIKLHNL